MTITTDYKVRLTRYRRQLRDHEYLRTRILSTAINQEFDVTSHASPWSHKITLRQLSIADAKDAWNLWESANLPEMREYEYSQYDDDLRYERLEYMEHSQPTPNNTSWRWGQELKSLREWKAGLQK